MVASAGRMSSSFKGQLRERGLTSSDRPTSLGSSSSLLAGSGTGELDLPSASAGQGFGRTRAPRRLADAALGGGFQAGGAGTQGGQDIVVVVQVAGLQGQAAA